MATNRQIPWDEGGGQRVRQMAMAHLAKLGAASMRDVSCVNALADFLASLKVKGTLSSFTNCRVVDESGVPTVQAIVCWNRGFQAETISFPKGCLTREMAAVFEVMES